MKYFNNETFSKINNFISSRFFMIAALVILVLLLIRQCGESENAKIEALREHNNYLASMDSVRLIKNEMDHIIQEKSAYELKASELSDEQQKLIEQLGLKSNGRGNTPNTVINMLGSISDVINIKSTIEKDHNGDEYISFVHNPEMPGNNKLKITGKTAYIMDLRLDPSDSTKYIATVVPGITNLLMEQNIDITTGIYRDPKTKRMMTRVSTTYPDLTFNDINSFDITDSPDTRRALKAARKEFGFGVQLGYGLSGSNSGISPGFYVGVGLQYSPKFLQFGK